MGRRPSEERRRYWRGVLARQRRSGLSVAAFCCRLPARWSLAMLNFSYQTRVFLCTQPVDLRKSFRGLCLLAESLLQQDPASGHWFVFLNRRADRMKLLGWDGRGFWIWYMHLEAGTFQSPVVPGDAGHLEIDVTQLSLIIHGIDLRSAKRRMRYSHAG